MKEYIERSKVLEAFGEEPMIWSDRDYEIQENNDWHTYTGIVKAIPAADVVERKRGEWKYIGGDEWCCSCCGFVASTEGRWEPMMAKFCEECGADMREVDHA